MASGAMMLQTVFEICGAFDLDLLRQAWQLLHDKKQILRTRLVTHNDHILQVVVNDTIQWGSGYNLAKYKASDVSKRVGSGDPLFRYAIVNEGERSFKEGLLDLAKLKSEPQGPTFRSFVEWKKSQSNKKNKAVMFWKQYLAGGYEDLEGLRRPFPDYVRLSCSQLSRTINIKKATGMDLSDTLSTIGPAAWALAVGSLWAIENVIFASVKMGRQMAKDSPLPRVESSMGPMMAMFPVRVRLRKDITFGEFILQQKQDHLISTIQHEHEAWSTFRECLGAQAILLGTMDWHPLGSDLFSRILE